MITSENIGLEVVSGRLAESILIALNASKFALDKIYSIRKICLSTTKEKHIDGIAKSCAKKFPAIDAKITKNSNFQSLMPTILKLFEEYYLGLAELAKLRELIFSIFVTMESFLISMDANETPDISIMLLEMISNYTCCIYLFNKMEDKKSIVSMYSAAFNESYKINEPHKEILNRLIIDFTNPWTKLWEDCERIFPIMDSMLTSLHADIKLKCIDSEQMETAAQFSLSNIPHELAIPVLCKNPNLLCLQSNYLCKWVYMCVLACPRLLISNGQIEGALHTILNNYPVMHLYKDEVINPFKELSARLEETKGTSRIIKTLQEWSQFAISIAPITHRQRRLHLRTVLSETYYFITDQPGLLGPKFIQIIQLLSSAICELEYYLISSNWTPELAAKTKSGRMEYQFDPDIAPFIFYINKIRFHIQKYASIVQYYFYQFLTMHDKDGVAHFYKEAKEVKIQKAVMKSIANSLGAIPKLEYGKHVAGLNTYSIYLDVLRLQIHNNWKLSSYVKKTDSFIVFINNMSLHAYVADNTTKFLDEYLSYSTILLKHRLLMGIFRETMDNPVYAHYSLSIPESFSFLKMENVHFNNSVDPEKDFDVYFSTVFEMLTIFSQLLFQSFESLLHVISSENMYITSKDLSNIWMNMNLSHLDIYKKMGINTIKDIANVVYERLNNTTTSEYVDSDLFIFYNFCYAINRTSEIVIEDVIFNLPNFLYPEIDSFLQKKFATILQDTSGDMIPANSSSNTTFIKKPSVVLKEMNSIFEAFSLLESYLNAKYLPIVSSALMQQYAVKNPIDPTSTTIAFEYGLWYIDDLINKHLKLEGMLYSPMRKCFVVKSVSTFPADDYTDTYEMQALAELLGPYGITTICDLIVKYIQSILEEIYKLFCNISPILIQASPNVCDSSVMMDDVYKKFKYIDDIFYNLTLIGAALTLRQLMLDGIRSNNETYCPLFSRAVKFGTNNKAKLTQFYESFAYNPKIPPNYHLMKSLSKLAAFQGENSDSLWTSGFLSLYLFITPFLATTDNIEYIPLLGAHANNCHLISLTFHTLVPIFYTMFEKKVSVSKKNDQLKTFYRDLGIAVMRMSSGTFFNLPIKDKDSVLVFYDQFMEHSCKMKMTKKLFDIIPYSLISQCHTDIYTRIKAKSKNKRNQQITA